MFACTLKAFENNVVFETNPVGMASNLCAAAIARRLGLRFCWLLCVFFRGGAIFSFPRFWPQCGRLGLWLRLCLGVWLGLCRRLRRIFTSLGIVHAGCLHGACLWSHVSARCGIWGRVLSDPVSERSGCQMLATNRKRRVLLPSHRRHRRGGCGCLALLTSSLRSSRADIAAALILRVALRAAAHDRHARAREQRHDAVCIGVVVQECLELQAHLGSGQSERDVA